MLNVMGGVRTVWYSPGYPPLPPHSPAVSGPEGIDGGDPTLTSIVAGQDAP